MIEDDNGMNTDVTPTVTDIGPTVVEIIERDCTPISLYLQITCRILLLDDDWTADVALVTTTDDVLAPDLSVWVGPPIVTSTD